MNPIHTLIVHPGTFHADDGFAAGAFKLLVQNLRVIRKEPSQTELDDPAIAVADVGGVYDPETNCFDHHQPVGGVGDHIARPTHTNERPMAAFGLMWETYGEQVVQAVAPDADAEQVAIRVKSSLVFHIDAEDNGYRANTYSVSQLIGRMNGDPETPDENFTNAVELATQIIRREIVSHAKNTSTEHLLLEAIATATTGVIKLVEFMPWKRLAASNPNILFAIYPSNREGWVLECSPPAENPMAQKIPMPEWTIHNEMLRRNFNIVFAHSNRFMVVCKAAEDAAHLAEEIIREHNQKHPVS